MAPQVVSLCTARRNTKSDPMNTLLIEHVKVEDLPQAWRDKLAKPGDAHVTVRIEEETRIAAPVSDNFATNDPAFGIWRDRTDIADVAEYSRKLRLSRYNRDGSRNRP
jgi:hypothetical protein